MIEASWNGRVEIIKFLLKKGADIEVKNNNGKTFYYYPKEKEEIDFLLKDIEERKRMIKPCKK